jgi:hypothetical protein
MRQLLQVSVAVVLALSVALVVTPARAANGVALVECDLFAAGGPKVTVVQSHGINNDDGIERRLFVGITDLRSDDFAGRDCAEVLSGVLNDGLNFQAMQVFGEDAGSAIWFFRD